ncbi:MAG: hypothetical protein IH571_01020, partial [Acholeplasmataceae bacterium]|nr:hypothetical protein [Acholeplasmataceae bacterium]
TGLWVPGIVYSNTYPLTLIKTYGFDYLYMLFDREATIYAILSALMLFFVFRSIKYPKVKRFSYLMVRYSLLLIAVAMVLKVLYFELSNLSAIRLPMDVMVYYLYLSAYVMLGIGALFSFLFFLSKKKG